MNGDSTRSRVRLLARGVLCLGLFGACFGVAVTAGHAMSPWDVVMDTANVVLVSEGCQFSEVSTLCLRTASLDRDAPASAVPVPTEMNGEFAEQACDDAREALLARGGPAAQLSVRLMPRASWCERLAAGGHAWMIEHNGEEQWPLFVRDGEIVGRGMDPDNFAAVGESAAGERLDECLAEYRR